MRVVQCGTVVVYEGQFYLYTPGHNIGEYQLLPIKVDSTREKLDVTPGMVLTDYLSRRPLPIA